LEAIFSQHKDDLFYLESIFLEDRAYIWRLSEPNWLQSTGQKDCTGIGIHQEKKRSPYSGFEYSPRSTAVFGRDCSSFTHIVITMRRTRS
jgi:hypothetical protein